MAILSGKKIKLFSLNSNKVSSSLPNREVLSEQEKVISSGIVAVDVTVISVCSVTRNLPLCFDTAKKTYFCPAGISISLSKVKIKDISLTRRVDRYWYSYRKLGFVLIKKRSRKTSFFVDQRGPPYVLNHTT